MSNQFVFKMMLRTQPCMQVDVPLVQPRRDGISTFGSPFAGGVGPY